MVAINMRLMPPRIIGREACLCVKGLSRLSKDPRPKRCATLERRRNTGIYESGRG
jgi:hypothetical protein